MRQIRSITVARAMEKMKELSEKVITLTGEQFGPLVFFSPSDPLDDKVLWFPHSFENIPQVRLIFISLKFFTQTLRSYKWFKEWGIDIGDVDPETVLIYNNPDILKYLRRGGFRAILIRLKGKEMSVIPLSGICPEESIFNNIPSEWISLAGTVKAERWSLNEIYEELSRLSKKFINMEIQ